jgi:predicted ABC-type ATPase
MLQQEVNQLKAEAEQQMIKQIKEYSSKEQQTTPNETVFSKSILERDVKTNPKRDDTSSPNSNLD